MKEINKHTLIEALASLPEYEPPRAVWDGIEGELVLQKKVAEMPEYEPPNLVWNNIQNDLVLQKGIAELPEYAPPASVWAHISETLKTTESKPNGRVVSMRKWMRYAAAAAVIGIVTVIGINQFGTTATSDGQLTYSVETVDEDLLKKDWNEDEDAFEYLMNICKERVIACENPEFKSLKIELEELNDAKAMLEEAIGSYGTDANLIAEMRQIEFARTDIVKRMIDNVI
jgi:hypothetical protein